MLPGSAHSPLQTQVQSQRAATARLPHQQGRMKSCRTYAAAAPVRQAGPTTEVPDYTQIDSSPLNRLVMALFRSKMVAATGTDSALTGYDAIIDLTRTLNSSFPEARQVQEATRGILNSLFPSWLPGAFKVMFSKPLPDFSCRLNAFATAATCQWLMGPCAVNDVELDDGRVGQGMGVLVERCRYLEQSGCASVCINSCKVPTQEFFAKDMGLPLTMTPNYEDFSCQFSFGKTPPPREQDEAFNTPCFMQCPSKAARYTDGSSSGGSSSGGSSSSSSSGDGSSSSSGGGSSSSSGDGSSSSSGDGSSSSSGDGSSSSSGGGSSSSSSSAGPLRQGTCPNIPA